MSKLLGRDPLPLAGRMLSIQRCQSFCPLVPDSLVPDCLLLAGRHAIKCSLHLLQTSDVCIDVAIGIAVADAMKPSSRSDTSCLDVPGCSLDG